MSRPYPRMRINQIRQPSQKIAIGDFRDSTSAGNPPPHRFRDRAEAMDTLSVFTGRRLLPWVSSCSGQDGRKRSPIPTRRAPTNPTGGSADPQKTGKKRKENPRETIPHSGSSAPSRSTASACPTTSASSENPASRAAPSSIRLSQPSRTTFPVGAAVGKQGFPGIEGLHERRDPLNHGFVEESERTFRIRRGVVELQAEDILPVDRNGAAGILREQVPDRNKIVPLTERRIRQLVDGVRIVSPPARGTRFRERHGFS